MTFHRPVHRQSPAAPARLLGEIAFRRPAGGLGWAARIGVIAGAAILLWGVIFLLARIAIG